MNVVRGEADLDVLAELGVVVRVGCNGWELAEPSDLPVVIVPPQLLLDGLVFHWTKGTELRDWARIVLALNALDLRDVEDHPAGDELLEAIWDASAGVDLPESRIRKLQEAVGW